MKERLTFLIGRLYTVNIDFVIELFKEAENGPAGEGRHRESHDFTNLYFY